MGLKENVKKEFDNNGSDKHYLLAMSGGIDSTVLFYVMREIGVKVSVAHANFGLREAESDADATFVKMLCDKYNIPFYVKKFDTRGYLATHNESIQSAARKLRYQWFYELLDQHKFFKIVTAHTLNDSVETFMINLLRGTGIHGLVGIQNQDKIIRPMLSCTREDVSAYAEMNNIVWREDASNAEDIYVRNQIRHHIIPILEHMEPNFLSQFEKTSSFLQGDIKIIDSYVKALRDKLFVLEGDTLKISIRSLRQIEHINLIYYLFKPFGFYYPLEIIKLCKATESAEMVSERFRLIKNRHELLLTPLTDLPEREYTLTDLSGITDPIHLRFTVFNKMPTLKNQLLDLQKIKFPLSLRIRKSGDVFYPSGMKGKSKKLSKFYKDLKLSKLEKERTWLLCDADDNIIWVVGHRYDERFKATNKTRKWLHIEKLD